MISIILNSYAPTKNLRHMDIACIAAIRKFTDGEYEIIIVDNDQTHRFRDDYGKLAPYLIIEQENHTVYESYNIGAQTATGEYLVFIQSDVYVTERAINKLVKYLEKFDVAFPQQLEKTREQIKELYEIPDGEEAPGGWRDAGVLAITRKAFDKVGGWDGRFQNMLGEAAFYRKMSKAGLSWTANTNAIITHIMAGNNLSKDASVYNPQMEHDAQLLKEFYD